MGPQHLNPVVEASTRLAFPSAICEAPGVCLYLATGSQILVYDPTTESAQVFAGSPMEGFKNGPRLDAFFGKIGGLVLLPSGDLLVSDPSHHCIRMVTTEGLVETFAGTGDAGLQNGQRFASQFNRPLGLCLTPSGNVLVADCNNNIIRQIILSTGMVSTFNGMRPAAPKDDSTQGLCLYRPNQVCVTLLDHVVISSLTTTLPTQETLVMMQSDGSLTLFSECEANSGIGALIFDYRRIGVWVIGWKLALSSENQEQTKEIEFSYVQLGTRLHLRLSDDFVGDEEPVRSSLINKTMDEVLPLSGATNALNILAEGFYPDLSLLPIVVHRQGIASELPTRTYILQDIQPGDTVQAVLSKLKDQSGVEVFSEENVLLDSQGQVLAPTATFDSLSPSADLLRLSRRPLRESFIWSPLSLYCIVDRYESGSIETKAVTINGGWTWSKFQAHLANVFEDYKEANHILTLTKIPEGNQDGTSDGMLICNFILIEKKPYQVKIQCQDMFFEETIWTHERLSHIQKRLIRHRGLPERCRILTPTASEVAQRCVAMTGIKNKSTLIFAPRLADTVHTIRTLGGSSLELKGLEDTDTLRYAAELLEVEHDMNFEDRLPTFIFTGRILAPDRTLASADIKPGSFIVMMLKKATKRVYMQQGLEEYLIRASLPTNPS